MITVTQSYNFPGGPNATEVYYTMSSSNTCVSVTPVSGTVDPGTTVEFTFSFQSESCFSTTFTLVTWDDVCETKVSNVFSIASPCSSLDGTISNVPSGTNPFIFTVVPTGGVPGYTIEWQYNTALFKLTSARTSSNDTLELNLRSVELALPHTTQIKAKITDSNGCSETVSHTYTFCIPVASNIFATAACIPSQTQGGLTVGAGVGGIQLNVSECAGTTTNWSSVNLSYDTTKLYVTVDTSGIMTVYGVVPLTATTYNINYTVLNSLGIQSNTGIVTVSIPTCATPVSGPSIASSSTKLPSGFSSGTTVSLALEDITFASE